MPHDPAVIDLYALRLLPGSWHPRQGFLSLLFGSVEDSLSDDIVSRLALVATELASVVDRIVLNEGFQRLIELLGQEDVQGCLTDVLCASSAAQEEAAALPSAKGDFGGLWQIATDPATQDALRYMVLLSKHMNKR